ncbi:glycoprotein precursor [Mojui dos Campos virus]|uniref:Envelopment polyprotein n=1 Tax=Mojui dos Campos virus TaxID=1543245 RepID=A0A088MJ16_9VIRU|nr:glycoprotein precursor [Mojui dos Campos virus]
MMTVLVVLLLSGWIQATPLYDKCFSGTSAIKETVSTTGISNSCVRDDVSIIKTESTAFKNTTGVFATNKVYRKWTVEKWSECKPKLTIGGSINVFKIKPDLALEIESYSCTTDCTIDVDKDNAQIVLSTNGLNRYEVLGTTSQSGWFKTTASISLDHTCEHLKINCGVKSVQIHACFKHHMSCIRYLKSPILPKFMVVAFCENIELIILLTAILLLFTILNLIMKTYLCYLMIPIFIPISYLYGFIYMRITKMCKHCGLPSHPFSKCGTHCMCGSHYDTSDRMRLHRESGLCSGYKPLRSARVLCKAKSSAFTLSIICSVLLLSFVTPINGLLYTAKGLDNNTDIIEDYESLKYNYEILEATGFIITIDWIVITIMVIVILAVINIKLLYMSLFVFCKACGMYHLKMGLKARKGFTNRCNTCICGFNVYLGHFMHKTSIKCTKKLRVKTLKNLLILILFFILTERAIVSATNCFEESDISEECIIPLGDNECSNKLLPQIVNEIHEAKNLLDVDKPWLLSMPIGINDGIKFILNQKSSHSIYLSEYAFTKMHCSFYSGYNQLKGDSKLRWRNLFHPDVLHICEEGTQKICKCFTGLEYSNIESSKNDITTYYISKQNELNHDVNYLLELLCQTFPGTTCYYVRKQSRVKDVQKLNNLVVNLMKKITARNYINAYLFLLNTTLSVLNMSNWRPSSELMKSFKSFRTMSEYSRDTIKNAQRGVNFKTCSNAKVVDCISAISHNPIGTYLECTKSGSKFLLEHVKDRYYTNSNGEGLCFLDSYCYSKYLEITHEELMQAKGGLCRSESAKYTISTSVSRCQMVKSGSCTWTKDKDEHIKVFECSDGNYYEVGGDYTHSLGEEIGVYCFNKDCSKMSFNIAPEKLKDCKWDENAIKPHEILNHYHYSIESYYKSLMDKIGHNLEIHHYIPTKDLPHVKPNYQAITLKGNSIDDGFEDSYIEFDMQVGTGIAMGLNVMSPEKTKLFDIIVYIESASVHSSYQYLYSTGPTIGINLKHDEVCTGSCPTVIPHQNDWLTFSQERSSRWGCEEWGCLAINTGCLFGSCQDIIRKELSVYKKFSEEETSVNLCVILASNNYCHKIDSYTALISENIDAQFITTSVNTLPSIVAIKNHKVLKGQINDIGEFKRGCGSVQVTNKTIQGFGNPKFDYICHAAQRKDVVVRRCMDNFYESCQSLVPVDKYVITGDIYDKVLTDYSLKLGLLKVKLKLGDVLYKTALVDLNIEGTATCVGCIHCLENIVCEIKIEPDALYNCKIKSNCEPMYDTVSLSPKFKSYNIKLKCSSDPENMKISLCNKDIPVKFNKIKGSTNIEIKNADQSSYVREEDNKCETWLCKAYNEGIGIITKPIFDWIKEKGSWALLLISALIGLAVMVYVLLPCIKLIVNKLKAMDAIYKLENKIK